MAILAENAAPLMFQSTEIIPMHKIFVTVVLIFSLKDVHATFQNPLWGGADPYAVLINGTYYYVGCNGDDQIWIGRSSALYPYVDYKPVYTFPEGQWNSKEVWGPAALFQWNDGRLYMYYTADNGDNVNHRIGVLRAKTSNPQGEWEDLSLAVPVNTGGQWAISMTPFQDLSGNWYVTWSGWRDQNPFPQVTYIAQMISPTEIGPRVEISAPEYAWENSIQPIQEGQHVFRRGDKLFLLYSGNASWTDEYCVGALVYHGGNVLDPVSWKKRSEPIMQKTTQVFGPGGPAVVTSTDGNEFWMYYHSNNYSNSGWALRSINLIQLAFDANNNLLQLTPTPWQQNMQGPSLNTLRGTKIAKNSQSTAMHPRTMFNLLGQQVGVKNYNKGYSP